MAERLKEDQWQAFATHEAGRSIGRWLESRGGLERPIRTFTMQDLEAMAAIAIGRWALEREARRQLSVQAGSDADAPSAAER